MGRGFDLIFDMFDVLFSDAENGEPRVNVGDDNDGGGRAAGLGMWGVAGFVSMPDAPDGDGAAQVITIQDGQQKRVIASRDNRWSSRAGALAPGDRAIVSSSKARFILKKATDLIALITENAKDGGYSQMLALDGASGENTILNSGCVVKQTKDSFTIAIDGGPSFVMNKEGVTITAANIWIAGGGVQVGVMPGNLPPPPVTNSAAISAAGPANLISSTVTIAT
jgi:hypothetical protein